MTDMSRVLYELRIMDDIGESNSIIHNINPAIKIIITLIYIVEVISLKNFNLRECIIIFAYPLILFLLGKVPPKVILKKIIVVLPVVIGISFINLLLDCSYNQIILSLLLLFKCIFSVTGGVLLIVTTGMNNIAIGLRKLKVPQILVTQILMLYRYIMLMVEYGSMINSAYKLRTLNEKGISMKDFGNIIGQMLLKSFDRAENVYAAMKLRGFEGEYYSSTKSELQKNDLIYLIVWIFLFTIVRI